MSTTHSNPAAAFVGTWRLVAVRRDTGHGRRVEHPHGEHPSGMLLYTADGRMSVHVCSSDRTPLSSADPARAGEAESARAFAGYLGYGGRWTVDGDTVTHAVETASVPNMVGGEQVRRVRLDGDTLILSTPAVDTEDGPQEVQLEWRRDS